jgi:CO/xanthine dehydrogenase FAD-binding subunit
MLCDHYVVPDSLSAALARLADDDGAARVIAGGTDLAVDLHGPTWRKSGTRPHTLVDISFLPELRAIEEDAGSLRIGAAVTHAELAASPLIRRRAPVLADAAAAVGSPQVREVGTLGGNVVNALPAADTAIALLALDAVAEVASPEGVRVLPLEDLYAGVGRSTVDASREVVVAFRCAVPQGCAFQRLARRRALALPILNVGVALDFDDDLLCARARIAIGPVAVIPWRARMAEAMLEGAPLTAATINQAAEMARDETPCRASLRACVEYRKPMIRVLVKRALLAAIGLDEDGDPR